MSKERIREAVKKVRRDYDMAAMIRIVEAYRDKLDYAHPPIRTNKFLENVYSKVACEEILKRLKASGDLPFNITALDILEQYVDQMKHFESEHPNKQHTNYFIEAAFIGEYFIEQYWFNGLGDN